MSSPNGTIPGKPSFTMRLTAHDQTLLRALCNHYGLNRPDSLREAMRAVLTAASSRMTALHDGIFTPIATAASPSFSIRLKRKEQDG